MLKSGGRCLITQNIVPDEYIGDAKDGHYWSSPASRFAIVEKGDSFPLGKGYVHWFTEDELLDELRRTSFRIERFESDAAHGGEGYLRLAVLIKE